MRLTNIFLTTIGYWRKTSPGNAQPNDERRCWSNFSMLVIEAVAAFGMISYYKSGVIMASSGHFHCAYLIRIVIFTLLLIALLVTSMGDLRSQDFPDEIPDKFFITPLEAYDLLLENSDAIFLFTATIKSYLYQHPEGSRHFSAFRFDEFADHYPDKTNYYIFTNAGAGFQNRRMFHHLKSMGYSNIHIVRGGGGAWERAGLPIVHGNRVTFNDTLYRTKDYSIEKQIDGDWITEATYIDPTFSLLKKYQDMIPREGFHKRWYERTDLFDVTTAIEMNLQAPQIHNNKIWFGIGYYDGEGWRGYGGIGFYDPDTQEFGILRHPSLVGCSVREIYFSADRIYISTYAQYEGSRSICNGVVELNLLSFKSKSWLPTNIEDDLYKYADEWFKYQKYYDKSIREIIEDERFIRMPADVDFDPAEISNLRKCGLETYMLNQFHNEMQARRHAIENQIIVIDTTITIDESHQTIHIRNSREDTGIQLLTDLPREIRDLELLSYIKINMYTFANLYRLEENFVIHPQDEYYTHRFTESGWRSRHAYPGKYWSFDATLYKCAISLVDFDIAYFKHDTGKILPRFENVTFRITIGQLRN